MSVLYRAGTLFVLPWPQVRAADRGQRHGAVPHRLLGQGRAGGAADAPGAVPADAAAPGRRGERELGKASPSCTKGFLPAPCLLHFILRA